jgi:Undecaprenyl-phosphate glucose phosphotransferase
LRTRRRARTDNRRPVILIGNGEPLREYVEVIRQNPQLGIEILGWVDGPAQASTPALQGSIEELRDRLKPEAFVISYAAADNTKIDAFLKAAYNDTTKLFVLPDLRSYALLGLHLEDFSGIPLLALNQPKWSTLDLAIKRSVDILGSALGLLILSPFLMAIALAVKLTSSGPIFFGQLRMGLDGQQFKMWKFRTMRDGPAHAGWTIQNDPRRTKIGSFLRVTSIDELPQLWNILVGEMSLVGPRPEQPYFVENFKNDIPAYMLRHRMKAGLTGWAQVNGWRGDTSLHKRIECDLYYIRNWSVAFDFKIILLTIWRGFVHKNAY